MCALTMEELGFVRGGVEPAGGWDNPPMIGLPEPTFYDGFRPPGSNDPNGDAFGRAGGWSAGGGAGCPPASTEAQQIAAISGTLAGAKKVWDRKVIRLLAPYIQVALYSASIIGGAIGAVLAARAAAHAECWLRNTKQGPFVS